MIRIKIDPLNPTPIALQTAAHVLQTGGLIIFPSDSAYGLGANIYNEQTINNLFEIKNRPRSKPLSVLAAGFDQAQKLANFTPQNELIWYRLMPGPLTFVLPRSNNAPSWLGGNRQTIGLRYPESTVIQQLGQLAPPFTTTSANLSDLPTCYDPDQIETQFGAGVEKIALFLDAGLLPFRPASTVLDLTQTPPKILRAGPLSQVQLQNRLGCEVTE